MNKNRIKFYKYKIERFFTWPYRAFKASILCIRFPFLYPRNRWTDKHWNCWKINDYHKEHWTEAYVWHHEPVNEGVFNGDWKVINKWIAFKISFLDGIEKFLSIFHCIPSYTELDAMPHGWRKVFGIQMCKEIKRALLEDGRKKLYKYRIAQIKEKFGLLCWYDSCGNEETDNIIHKYEKISQHTCISCGRTAKYQTQGWIENYCEKCIPEKQKEHALKYYSDIPFYGWTNGEYYEKHKNNKDKEEL